MKNVEGAYTIGAGGLTKSLNVNPLTPATFEVSNLVVNPSEVEVGEPISISATVANTGDLEGAHEVMLKIDGLVEATEGVTLEGGKSTPVSFTATLDTIGSHSLEIGELSKNVTIKPEIWEIKTASYYDHETGDLEPEGTFKAGDTIWLFTQVAVATEPIEIHTNFSFGYSLYGPDGTLFNSDSSNAELTCYDLHTWFSIDTSYSDPPGYYTFAYWIEDVDRNVRNEENVTFYLEPPSPAEFEVIDLVISPSKVEPRATVTISVIVKNIGDLEGGYTVELKIDGVVEATKDVTLTGGATETASFTVTKNEAKTYSVTVDGLAGSFTVKPFASVSRDFEWEDHLGEKWTWSIDVEQWRYEYYQGLSHRAYTTEDYLKFVTYEDGQIKAMTDKLMEAYSDHEDAANCILAFVQTCFPYTPEDEEYWRYPVETLVDNGDCEDKAVLFASIMKAAEYDVALIVFEGHVMAGVVLWNEPKYGTQEFIHWFTSDEKRYYTCETTAEGWRVGDLPEEYEGESAHVLAVN